MVGPDKYIVICKKCGERGTYENFRPDQPHARAWKSIKHKEGCSSASYTYKQAREEKLFDSIFMMS